MLMTDLAKGLNNKGVHDNGCGSGKKSVFILKIVMKITGIDLRAACRAHDLEYKLKPEHKSPEHKKLADDFFELNLAKLLVYENLSDGKKALYQYWGWYKKLVDWYLARMPAICKGAVVAAGHSSYYNFQ